jgi:hypothetical protein
MEQEAAVPRTLYGVAALYGAAVRLYPPDFRREFASEMSRDFSQATQEAWGDGAWRSLAGLWTHMGTDLARTLIVQWLRSGWPAITLIPVAFATAGVGAAARILALPPVALPAGQPDRDEAALLLLVTIVLLIVMATIILTLWFTRPLRYRTRI